MKRGDIVEVLDASYNLFYGGSGEVRSAPGSGVRPHRWKVLLVGVNLPADRGASGHGDKNDLMLCEEGAPENILFTRARFCKPAQQPLPERLQDQAEVYRNACRILDRLKMLSPASYDTYLHPATVDGKAVIVFRRKKIGITLSDRPSVRYGYSKFVPEESLLDDKGQPGRTLCRMHRIAEETIDSWRTLATAMNHEAPLL